MTDRAIWKYGLGEHEVPAEYQVVHAGTDPSGYTCVWLSVPHASSFTSKIEVCAIGTGHPFSSGWAHAGSYVSGIYVWHILIREIPNTGEKT